MARPGTAASQGKGATLPPATVLSHNSVFVEREGKKLRGDLVVNDKVIALQAEEGGLMKKGPLRRIPLVYWEKVADVKLEVQTQMHQFAGSGHTTEACSMTVVLDDGTSRTYKITASLLLARNILGKLGHPV